MTRKLTAKQESFCVAYVQNGGNASAAYRQTYDASRMSDKVVWNRASELTKNGEVAVRIEQLQARIAETAAEAFDVSAETLVQELALVAYARQGKAADGTPVKVSEKVSALAQLCKISGLEKLTVQTLNLDDFANDPRFLTFDNDGNLLSPIESAKRRVH